MARGGVTLLLCTCLCDIYLHSRMIYRSSVLACFMLVLSVVQAVKFQLPSERHPKPSELLHPRLMGVKANIQNGMPSL